MSGSQLLTNYLLKYNPKIKLSANPWKVINDYNPTFSEELNTF